MKKSGTSKKVLLMSLLSLVMCCAMLAGSTFAWFTDSVTSGKNKIVAGNLDVELEYAPASAAEGGTIAPEAWKKVESTTNLFDEHALWEPGHTEYVYLRVRNAGSLALKYNFTLTAYGNAEGGPETTYTTAKGQVKLSDYLVANKIEGTAQVTDREKLWLTGDDEAAALGHIGMVGYTKSDALESGDSDAFTLAVYMPTSVGNDANWVGAEKAAGEDAPQIFLGISINATQVPSESDSFDDQYDKKAEGLLISGDYYATNPSELKDELNSAAPGETVVLRDDIEVDQSGAAITGEDVHLNLAGNAIVRSSASGNALKIGSNSGTVADATIENGQFVSKEGGNVIRFEGGSTTTFRDCDFICEAAGSTGNELIKNFNTTDTPVTITFENCTFDQGYINLQGAVNVVFKNCKFNWEDKNGSHFVEVGNTYGSISLEDCTFNYTNWWSGDLVEIGSIAAEKTMTVSLKNIKVTGTGNRTPYVVGLTFSGYKSQVEVTVTGENSYLKDSSEVWSKYEKDWS